MDYPGMYSIRQTIDASKIDNIEKIISQEIDSLEPAPMLFLNKGPATYHQSSAYSNFFSL